MVIDVSGPPFRLGVAAGEPSSAGVVIWAGLAPKQVQRGGMPRKLVEVTWEVAADEK